MTLFDEKCLILQACERHLRLFPDWRDKIVPFRRLVMGPVRTAAEMQVARIQILPVGLEDRG